LTWLEQQKFAKQVNLAITALDERRYRECLKTIDEAIARARKWKFTPDDTVAMAFVIRAGALWKTDDKQGALEASARAFTCMCGVESADVQLMIFDQLGTLLLETGYAQKAIPILEAAVGLGHRAGAQPLQTASRLERAAMACHRVGVHANAAAAFGKAIDLMTKEKGADALELASPYINLGNCYKRMQKLDDAVLCAEQGRNEEAEKYYLETLELRVQMLGWNHWRVGNTYNNLAGCRRRLRDFAGAEEYMRQAIEILDGHPEQLCNAIDTLSRLREDEGKNEEALSAATREREIQQGIPSPDLSEMATLFEREAALAERCGEEERARECRTQAIEMRQALAAAPPADRDLTNLPESLKALEQHLASSLERVRALEHAI
jgi:tetratricopeptide (TPR) repeat protein